MLRLSRRHFSYGPFLYPVKKKFALLFLFAVLLLTFLSCSTELAAPILIGEQSAGLFVF